VVERPLVRAVLDALTRGDRVRLLGGDRAGWTGPDDARAALDRAWASPAGPFDLTRVLREARPDGAPIVVVSDGLVADDPAAIAAARRLGVPVHVLGIGPAPARATLTQLAAVTGGTVRFVAPGDDVGAVAQALIRDLVTRPAPVAINWGALGATEVEPVVLPRLGAGQAMLVVAKIARAQPANARARGEVFAFEALGAARGVDGATTPRGPLARRWARARLGDLLVGPHDRAAVTRLALQYGLVSPYTSLVAIGDEVIVEGGVRHSVAVPVSLPSGMRWHAVKQAMDADAPVARSRAGDEEDDDAAPARRGAQDAPKKKGAPKPSAPSAPAAPAATADTAGPADKDERTAGKADAATSVRPRPEEAVRDQASPRALDSDQAELVATEQVSVAASGRRWRLTAALGGGLTFDHGARGLVALDGRLELGGRTKLGGEASLLLVGGRGAEGRALITVARAGLARWLELGFGAGVGFGDGTGVAAALRLRVDTPLPALAGFLRYDAGVVLGRPGLDTRQSVTLGVELSY
ncbi:MAG TPA: vWA domain-containing protein, partial [Kofleriaceae bacterium]